MIEVYHEPKREIEQILCAILNEHTSTRFFPNKGDQEMETPFGAVVCENAEPLVGGRKPRAYLCNVKVVYVSHMDEVDSQEHGANIAQIEDSLSYLPQRQDDKFSRYVPRHELYGYEISDDVIKENLDNLRLLEDHDTRHFATNDPDLFAKRMRESLYSIKEGNFVEYKYLEPLTAHYTFDVVHGENKVQATFHENIINDRYILSRKHLQISGLHISNITTNSENQSFADIFECIIGAQEIC
jgi:hypothetical protein